MRLAVFERVATPFAFSYLGTLRVHLARLGHLKPSELGCRDARL